VRRKKRRHIDQDSLKNSRCGNNEKKNARKKKFILKTGRKACRVKSPPWYAAPMVGKGEEMKEGM